MPADIRPARPNGWSHPEGLLRADGSLPGARATWESGVQGPVLHLFGDVAITVAGERRAVPDSCRRLLVWLALRRTRVDRSVAAGVLWATVDDHRASGNLRSALWRLRSCGLDLVEATTASLALRDDVTVDAHVAADWAQRLISGSVATGDLAVMPWFAESIAMAPGWDDDWAVLERERLRHRMLHAFELLSRLLGEAGRPAEGIRAARLVVDADPLRESAQCALASAYLAADDVAAARRVCEDYRRLHRRVFGVDPSPRLGELMSLPPPARLISGDG